MLDVTQLTSFARVNSSLLSVSGGQRPLMVVDWEEDLASNRQEVILSIRVKFGVCVCVCVCVC